MLSYFYPFCFLGVVLKADLNLTYWLGQTKIHYIRAISSTFTFIHSTAVGTQPYLGSLESAPFIPFQQLVGYFMNGTFIIFLFDYMLPSAPWWQQVFVYGRGGTFVLSNLLISHSIRMIFCQNFTFTWVAYTVGLDMERKHKCISGSFFFLVEAILIGFGPLLEENFKKFQEIRKNYDHF